MGLVFNPGSFRNLRNRDMTEEILAAFGEMGETVLIGDPEVLTATLGKWRQERLDLLVVSGGDGTVQRLVDEMLRIWEDDIPPRLLLLHGGTAGVVARETESIEPVIALSILREAFLKKQSLPTGRLRTLKVENRTTLSFGLGAFRNVSAEYITYGGQVALSHLYLGARLAGSYMAGGSFARNALKPCPWLIRIDEQEYDADHFVGLYASAFRRLPVFKPLREMECPEDGFKVLGIETLDRRAVARVIRPLLQRSSEGFPEQVMLSGAQRLEVTSGEGEIPYMADGEYYTESGSITVTVGPHVEVVRLDRIDQES
ncbi:diacylglycerol/lipid kinase family protein [Gemmatimonadota bacterium]